MEEIHGDEAALAEYERERQAASITTTLINHEPETSTRTLFYLSSPPCLDDKVEFPCLGPAIAQTAADSSEDADWLVVDAADTEAEQSFVLVHAPRLTPAAAPLLPPVLHLESSLDAPLAPPTYLEVLTRRSNHKQEQQPQELEANPACEHAPIWSGGNSYWSNRRRKSDKWRDTRGWYALSCQWTSCTLHYSKIDRRHRSKRKAEHARKQERDRVRGDKEAGLWRV